MNFYQIQTKFRDERRPRFGLMRGREFIMKDAYSFDKDQTGAKASYQIMAQAYRKIFDRFGLRYRAVAADSGAIGGDLYFHRPRPQVVEQPGKLGLVNLAVGVIVEAVGAVRLSTELTTVLAVAVAV